MFVRVGIHSGKQCRIAIFIMISYHLFRGLNFLQWCKPNDIEFLIYGIHFSKETKQ